MCAGVISVGRDVGCCVFCHRKGHNFMSLEFSPKSFQMSLLVLTPLSVAAASLSKHCEDLAKEVMTI